MVEFHYIDGSCSDPLDAFGAECEICKEFSCYFLQRSDPGGYFWICYSCLESMVEALPKEELEWLIRRE